MMLSTMEENNYIFKKEGFEQLTYASIENILFNCSLSLEKEAIPKILKKKIFTIVVECLENIQKHAVFIDKTDTIPYIYSFKIISTKNEYIILSSNLIHNTHISSLKRKVTLINQLNYSHLKELYKRTLKKTSISDKGGANLGILDIAIISNNKIDFSFIPIDDELSIYKIQIKLNKIL